MGDVILWFNPPLNMCVGNKIFTQSAGAVEYTNYFSAGW